VIENIPAWWPSPAKINLFLHVTDRRADGYHDLQTVFQFIDLNDLLQFQILDEARIECAYTIEGIAPEHDLVRCAASLLQAQCASAVGVQIKLIKHIPIGGGLGGASSNAATTLVALNRLWKTGLSRLELMQLGAGLGADVPVFIHGQAAWAEGIGDQLTSITLPEYWYLIIAPGVKICTQELFADPQLTRDHPRLKICAPEPGLLGNDFEPLVRARYPGIDAVFQWLEQYAQPFLTGTGSSVVAAFDSRPEAQSLADRCPQEFRPYVARGYNRSVLMQHID
jgi:4-diphosphocytidyl-2-C-methyl-D-erythritol kinase